MLLSSLSSAEIGNVGVHTTYKWMIISLGWPLFRKSCAIRPAQVHIMPMGTLRYHTKNEAAEATPHLAHGL